MFHRARQSVGDQGLAIRAPAVVRVVATILRSTSGTFLGRVATRGQLNSPWGLAMAPAAFGRFGGDLLVGNFGDGRITAFEREPNGSFQPRGQLRTADGSALTIDGLWALQFGNGTANNGPTDTLFFTAGPDDENHGLFGTIRVAG